MNKERIKGIITGFTVCAVLAAGALAVHAQTVTREITYGVQVNLNGQLMQFDADSQPFVMEGRTFLPVRAVADAVGLPVGFDADTNTVLLGNVEVAQTPPAQPVPEPTPVPVPEPTPAPAPVGQAMRDVAPAFESHRMAMRTVNMRGESFPNSFRWDMHMSFNPSWSHHDLNGRFTTLTGVLGRVDGSGDLSRTVRFIGDGRELASYTVTADSRPEEISINVTGVTTLRIEISSIR